jgi:hypothetical protein
MLVLVLVGLLMVPATATGGPGSSPSPKPDAAAAGRCVPFGADYAPSRGDPQCLRVRFTVAQCGRNRPIYLHYIGPNRHLKRTVFLGTARGLCGYLRTGLRRLFPFTARPGTWRLRFDTRRNYRVRARAPYVTLAVSVLRST